MQLRKYEPPETKVGRKQKREAEREAARARRRQLKAAEKVREAASSLATAVNGYRLTGNLRFYKTTRGIYRFGLGTAVAQVGIAQITGEGEGREELPERVTLTSDFGYMPEDAVAALLAITGMIPLRGKSLVPWEGTWLEDLFPTYKDAIGYLPSMYSTIKDDRFHEDILVWVGKLKTRMTGTELGCDGAGWRVIPDDAEGSQWPHQCRALGLQVGVMGKGELFPIKAKDLPEPYFSEYKRLKEEGEELPKYILEREQFKAGGKIVIKSGICDLEGEYQSGSAFLQDLIDKRPEEVHSMRVNLGIMNVHDTYRTMKLGPQIVLRCSWGEHSVKLAKEIAESNFWQFFGRNGEGISKIYDAVISGDESGEMHSVKEMSEILGVDYRENSLLADQAAARFQKKLYRNVVGLGMEALRGALWIHDVPEIPHNVIIAPRSYFERGLLRHGQAVVLGRYPIVSPQSGAGVYTVWDPRKLPKKLLLQCPWLEYNEGIVGRKSALMLDLAGDDDGDIGFIVTDERFVWMMLEPPNLVGGKSLWKLFHEKYPEECAALLKEVDENGWGIHALLPKERMFVEGYTVDKTKAKEPAKQHKADLARDHTGAVGIYTKVQDAFLRLMAHPEMDRATRTRLMLGAMAMAYMVQCAVDMKKNTIPAYRWWKLLDPNNWTIGVKEGVPALCPCESFTGNGKDIPGEIVRKGEKQGWGTIPKISRAGKPYKAYRNPGDKPWVPGAILDSAGKIRASAVFGWAQKMCVEAGFPLDEQNGDFLGQLLPWDKQKALSVADIAGLNRIPDDQVYHPIDHVFNHVTDVLIPAGNFPKYLLGADTRCEDLRPLVKAKGIEVGELGNLVTVNSRGKTIPTPAGRKLLAKSRFDAVIKSIGDLTAWLTKNKVNEKTQSYKDLLEGAITACKATAATAISPMTLEEVMGLVKIVTEVYGSRAAWSLVNIGSNALTKALGMKEDPVCSHMADNWADFEARVATTAKHLDDKFKAHAMVLFGQELDEEGNSVEKSDTFAATHPGVTVKETKDGGSIVVTALHKCAHCTAHARSEVLSARGKLPEWAVEGLKKWLTELNEILRDGDTQESIRAELTALGLEESKSF